mgnify:CR=1 FL=1
MMDELWREEEKKTLESIAKLTELGKVKWECVEYNPLCFMNETRWMKPLLICARCLL